MTPGNGDVLNLYITRGDIWGLWGTNKTLEAPSVEPLRDKLLNAMSQHCRPNRLDVLGHTSIELTRQVLSERLARGITVENIVLHELATIIETGNFLLTQQLGKENGRVIVLVASPYLLGGATDAQGDHAVRILDHCLRAIYNLASGIYVTDGSGYAPIPVEDAQLLEGRLVVKED